MIKDFYKKKSVYFEGEPVGIWHDQQVDFFWRLGLLLGFDSRSEFKLPNNDKADVIWFYNFRDLIQIFSKKMPLMAIEVETDPFTTLSHDIVKLQSLKKPIPYLLVVTDVQPPDKIKDMTKKSARKTLHTIQVDFLFGDDLDEINEFGKAYQYLNRSCDSILELRRLVEHLFSTETFSLLKIAIDGPHETFEHFLSEKDRRDLINDQIIEVDFKGQGIIRLKLTEKGAKLVEKLKILEKEVMQIQMTSKANSFSTILRQITRSEGYSTLKRFISPRRLNELFQVLGETSISETKLAKEMGLITLLSVGIFEYKIRRSLAVLEITNAWKAFFEVLECL